MARYAIESGFPARLSLLFLALPATLVATDRLVIDMPFRALAADLVRYSKSPNLPMLFTLLSLSCLCRETGLIFAVAFTAAALLNRRWRHALLFAATAIPASLWYAYVQFRTGRIEVQDWLVATLYPGFWETVYNFSRPYSPMLLILAAHGASASRRPWLWLLPFAMMDLRIGLQLAPQLLGVFGIHFKS